MRLHVLGSGTALPSAHRGASGYACVSQSGAVLLLECGPGSTRRWPQAGFGFDDICGVALSHFHVDHVSDLPAMLFGRNVRSPPVKTSLTMIGPVGLRRFVEDVRALYGRGVHDPFDTQWVVEMSDEMIARCGPFEIRAREVRHSPGALGFLVCCDGRSLAFSGDSGPCDALRELVTGVDLALVECSYPDSRESSGHLNVATVSELLCDASVERAVLTHLYPDLDAVDVDGAVRNRGYRGWLNVASDGAVFDV